MTHAKPKAHKETLSDVAGMLADLSNDIRELKAQCNDDAHAALAVKVRNISAALASVVKENGA